MAGAPFFKGRGTSPVVRQRGMTLLEVVVAAAIFVVAAAAFLTLTQGGRVYSGRSSLSQFDAALAYGQALAATSGNGATLVFSAPTQVGAAFDLTVYSGRPTGASALRQGSLPMLHLPGSIFEAGLGGVPFTIFLNSAGHASGSRGAVSPGSVIARDPGCPAGERAIALTFSDSHGSRMRTIPCNTALAGVPLAIGTVAPGTSATP